MFQRSFCGSWHRTEGHGGVPELLEALWNPLVPKHLLRTEGHTEYSTGETDAWGNNHRQLQVSNPPSVVSADVASKTCLAAAWGQLQAQHLPTHTHGHTPCQDCAKTLSFSRKAEPQSLMIWKMVFEESLGLSEAASLQQG